MSGPSRILIIDDDYHIADACMQTLTGNGCNTDWADNSKKGLELAERYSYDVMLLDLNMPDIYGMEVLRRIKRQDPDAMVIIITGYGTIQNAVDAMKLGAFDFITKPFSPQELKKAVHRAFDRKRLARENLFLKQELERRGGKTHLVGESKTLRRIKEIIELVAPTDSTVLITGPSGTGKGVVARKIHELSRRAHAPFVSVDCGSLVPTLFESELFGHVKGAFTGADQNKMGKLEMAHEGTVFFDEISNISLQMQAKLLKVVEERVFSRVGSHREIHADVRIIAATNVDILKEIREGRFREDLYYRLNVVSIDIPPLQNRREDIPLLVEYFLREQARKRGRKPLRISPEAMNILRQYSWPGNVRELENTIERLGVLCQRDEVRPDDLLFAGLGIDDSLDPESLALSEMERRHILKVLNLFGGHRSKTAAALGIDRKTLREKMRRYGL